MGRLAPSIQDMKMQQLKIISRYRITPKLVVYTFMKHSKLPPPFASVQAFIRLIGRKSLEVGQAEYDMTLYQQLLRMSIEVVVT